MIKRKRIRTNQIGKESVFKKNIDIELEIQTQVHLKSCSFTVRRILSTITKVAILISKHHLQKIFLKSPLRY